MSADGIGTFLSAAEGGGIIIYSNVARGLLFRGPGTGRVDKRPFNMVAAWSSFVLSVPILLISRRA